MQQIEFRNVTKKYDDFVAVKDVSFTVDKGEFAFLIGPSGAGKSTLVKMLIREDSPDEGEIYFNEINIQEIEKKDIPNLRRSIGVVFQDFKVLDSKTVWENVAVALEVADVPKHEINEVVPNVLNLVKLQGKKDSYPTTLSGGEKQRLSIARALAHEPNVLVADEPTGMIDPKASNEVVDVLEKINSLGTTVLMATHDQTIVDRLKKRVIVIDSGVVTSDVEEGKYAE